MQPGGRRFDPCTLHLKILVAALFAIALAIRLSIAWSGGMWADEGFLLEVIEIPSWSGMLSFLHFHESHPPLFYAVMRLWAALVGNDDARIVLLPALVGALIVPAVYVAGRSIFNNRTAVIAAALAVISAPLSEHSSQVRPYGLMALLVLSSCVLMAKAIEKRTLKCWVLYAIATTLLVYVHNWAWLVVAGQHVTMAIMLGLRRIPARQDVIVRWVGAWTAILLCYAPWFSALAYQRAHAGHGPVILEGIAAKAEFGAYALFTLVQTMFPARPEHALVVSLAGIAVGAAALFAVKPTTESHFNSRIAVFAIAGVAICTLTLALVLSPTSNFFIPRCLVTLIPLFLLLFSRWLASGHSTVNRSRIVVQFALVGLLVATSVSRISSLVSTPRSNAREAALAVMVNAREDDLLIVAPEWYAPSFNRYFTRKLHQIDYPTHDRTVRVDFANVWERVSHPMPLEQARLAIRQAALGGQRVWLVTGKPYERAVSPSELSDAVRLHQPKPVLTYQIQQLIAAANGLYGKPVRFDNPTIRPLYDDLSVAMYSRDK